MVAEIDQPMDEKTHTTRLGCKPKWLVALAVVILLVLHALLAISSIQKKSITFDETAHLASGYLYWTLKDYRFNAESGNLPQRWAAIPSATIQLPRPNENSIGIRDGSAWAFGDWWLFKSGLDADRVLRSGRIMIVLLSLGLGLVTFWWANDLFGPRGGLIAMALWAVSPTMIAHGRLVTSDMCAALFFTLTTFTVWRLLHQVTIGRWLAVTFATACLFLSKMSAVLIIPIAAMLLLIRLIARQPLDLKLFGRSWHITSRLRMALIFAGLICLTTLTTWGAIWSAYGFRYQAGPDSEATFIRNWDEMLQIGSAQKSVIVPLRDHQLLPEAYLWGMAYTFKTTTRRDTFMAGQHSQTGWRTFFPYAVAMKTPLPVFGLLILAAVFWLRSVRHKTDTTGDELSASKILLNALYRTTPLWAFLTVYWLTAIQSSINIGHRHMLPTYTPMFVLAGGIGAYMKLSRRGLNAIVTCLLIWTTAETLSVHPHHLSYFNQFAGGPSGGYRRLVDSSLDWGQDLPRLAEWADEYREMGEPHGPIHIAYFGRADPAYYGLQATWLHSLRPIEPITQPPSQLKPGVYCISATLLQTVYNKARGPWRPSYEERYRHTASEIADFQRLRKTDGGQKELLARRDAAAWVQLFDDYNQLRTARICRYLLQTEPAERIGYSIHIYHLDEIQLREALAGPIMEMKPSQ